MIAQLAMWAVIAVIAFFVLLAIAEVLLGLERALDRRKPARSAQTKVNIDNRPMAAVTQQPEKPKPLTTEQKAELAEWKLKRKKTIVDDSAMDDDMKLMASRDVERDYSKELKDLFDAS